MSRQLPTHPNLDHLRKQAKDLLAAARHEHPDWQLADAQFALARDYGFASWPAMKVEVDRLIAAAPPRPEPDPPVANEPGGAATVECLLDGAWRANIAESERHPALLFASATLTIASVGTRVTVTQVVVGADGQPSGSSMTIDADGLPHQPAGVGAAHWLTAHWADARTLEVVDTVDGREQGRGRYQVSLDGRRLTVTAAAQRLVFDRA